MYTIATQKLQRHMVREISRTNIKVFRFARTSRNWPFPVPQWFQFTQRATSRLSQFILSDNQLKKVKNASIFLGRLAFLVTKFQKLNVTRPGQLQNLVTQICLGIPTHMYSPLSGLTTSTVFVANTQNKFLKKTTGCDSWESACGE